MLDYERKKKQFFLNEKKGEEVRERVRGTLRIGKRPKSLEEAEHKRIQEKAIVSFFSSIFLGLCFLLFLIIFFSRASWKIIEVFELTGI